MREALMLSLILQLFFADNSRALHNKNRFVRASEKRFNSAKSDVFGKFLLYAMATCEWLIYGRNNVAIKNCLSETFYRVKSLEFNKKSF
jgi:hypothetical protein